MGWFSPKKEPRPWQRLRDQIEEDAVRTIERKPRVTYRVEVGTTHDTYTFESEKPIQVTDTPETVIVIVDDGESGTIKFYKRNLTFVQEYIPS